VHSKVYELRVAASPEEVWKLLSSPEALKKLTPPANRLRLLGHAEAVKDGQLQVLRVWVMGIIPMVWKVRISQVTPPYGFTDQAEKSPFKFWRHRHDYIPDGDGTLIRDMIAYIVPWGKLGKALNRLFVSKELDRQFLYRRNVLLQMFGRRE
jgi:ligand-binding SRPBCC domain-containing protein